MKYVFNCVAGVAVAAAGVGLVALGATFDVIPAGLIGFSMVIGGLAYSWWNLDYVMLPPSSSKAQPVETSKPSIK